MNNKDLNYLITSTNDLLIGMPNDKNWHKSYAELNNKHLIIKNTVNEYVDFEIHESDLIKIIKDKKKAILSYIFNETPEFVEIEIFTG